MFTRWPGAGLFAPARPACCRCSTGHRGGWGGGMAWGREPIYGIYQENEAVEEPPVQLVYTLTRPRKTGFGDRPLPAGMARLFRADSDGRLQVVGEASLEHTA